MPSSITVSSISAITAAAGLSRIEDWTKLTVQQINSMIFAVQNQISQNNIDITNLTSSISAYDIQINQNPNLQKIFNDADFVYNSTLTEYIRVSTLVDTNLSSFAADTRLLSSYSTTAAGYRSTLDAARRDYSSLLSTSGQIVPLIRSEASTLNSYTSSFTMLSSFCAQFSPSYTRFLTSTNMLNKTVGDLQSTLTQVSLDYNSLSTLFAQNPTDTALSTNAQTKLVERGALTQAINANQALLAATNISTTTFSTLMGGCDVRAMDMLSQIQQTSTNISMYLEISTAYSVGSPKFLSQFQYWSTMEVQANSSITSYTQQRSTLITQRDKLSGEITALRGTLNTRLGQLDTAAATFYSRKMAEMDNEVLEFQNASRECNAFTGLLTAQLMYQKLTLFDQVDTLSFYIQSTQNSGDIAVKATLEGQRSLLFTDQNSLQTQVDRLNPLDTNFMELDEIYSRERTYKASFLQARSTLHAMERNVIANPSTRNSIQTAYRNLWSLMNTAIDSANSEIGGRQTKWGAISSALNQVKSALDVDPLSKYKGSLEPFITYYPYTYNRIPIQDITQTVSVISEYALLPAIDFTNPAPSYNL